MRPLFNALLSFLSVGTLTAQAPHPNFNGTWVLDTAQSDKNPMTPAISTYIVVQHSDTLAVDRSNTSRPSDQMPDPITLKSHLVWAVDGAGWKNTLPLVGAEVETTTKAEWSADTMLVHIVGTVQGADLVQLDQWFLSADGSMLTVKRSASYGGMPMAGTTLVFKKQ